MCGVLVMARVWCSRLDMLVVRRIKEDFEAHHCGDGLAVSRRRLEREPLHVLKSELREARSSLAFPVHRKYDGFPHAAARINGDLKQHPRRLAVRVGRIRWMHVGIRPKRGSFEHRRFHDLFLLLRAHRSVHGEARRKRNQGCSEDTHDEWTAERRPKTRGLGEEMERWERGSGRNPWRGSRSDRSRLPVGRPLVSRRESRWAPRKERLENFGDSRRRRIGGQIAVRDAAFPVLGGGSVLFFVVVRMRVLLRVPVMVLFERIVKYKVDKRNDIEAQQPERTGKYPPVCSSSGHVQLPTSRPWLGPRAYSTSQVAHSQFDQPGDVRVRPEGSRELESHFPLRPVLRGSNIGRSVEAVA